MLGAFVFAFALALALAKTPAGLLFGPVDREARVFPSDVAVVLVVSGCRAVREDFLGLVLGAALGLGLALGLVLALGLALLVLVASSPLALSVAVAAAVVLVVPVASAAASCCSSARGTSLPLPATGDGASCPAGAPLRAGERGFVRFAGSAAVSSAPAPTTALFLRLDVLAARRAPLPCSTLGVLVARSAAAGLSPDAAEVAEAAASPSCVPAACFARDRRARRGAAPPSLELEHPATPASGPGSAAAVVAANIVGAGAVAVAVAVSAVVVFVVVVV